MLLLPSSITVCVSATARITASYSLCTSPLLLITPGNMPKQKRGNLQYLYLETEVANPPALLQICARVGADPGLGECLGEFLVHIFHLSSLDLHFPASWGWENTSELRLSARKGSAHQRHVYTGEN